MQTALIFVNERSLTGLRQNLSLRMGPNLGFLLRWLGVPRSTKLLSLSRSKVWSNFLLLFAIRMSSAKMISYSLILLAFLGFCLVVVVIGCQVQVDLYG